MEAKMDCEFQAIFSEDDEAMLTQLLDVGYHKAVCNLSLSDRSEQGF